MIAFNGYGYAGQNLTGWIMNGAADASRRLGLQGNRRRDQEEYQRESLFVAQGVPPGMTIHINREKCIIRCSYPLMRVLIMRVLISGATGFIGGRLSEVLAEAGHQLFALSRNPDAATRVIPGLTDAFGWRPLETAPAAEALEGTDAIVHLAGASVVGRWTQAKRRATSRCTSWWPLCPRIYGRSRNRQIRVMSKVRGSDAGR